LRGKPKADDAKAQWNKIKPEESWKKKQLCD
jgi:hypothetical protein